MEEARRTEGYRSGAVNQSLENTDGYKTQKFFGVYDVFRKKQSFDGFTRDLVRG
jgi:hypothetical protein